MVPPPKKDAFADLFQLATSSTSTKTNSLSMLERQKDLQKSQSLQKQQLSSSGLLSTWSNIDVLSGNSSRTSSPAQINPNSFNTYLVLTPSQSSIPASGGSSTASLPRNNVVDDPFDIFGEPAVSSTKPVESHSNGSSNRSNEISLLEGDFEDAFVKKQPIVEPQPQHTVAQPKLPTRQDLTPSPVMASRQHTLDNKQRQSPVDRTDSVLAQLVDIGFQIDDATEALEKQGADLQSCVNYIISKNSAVNSRGSTPRNSSRNVASKGLEELSLDFLRSAGYLFNKSRQTVLKNLEQLNLSGSNSLSPGVPEWMKNQQKYKDEATEKKFGNGELDYGSDSENINYDEIETFMKSQKEKDRERVKERFENIKTKALKKSSSAPSRSSDDDLDGHYGFNDGTKLQSLNAKPSQFQHKHESQEQQRQKPQPRGSNSSQDPDLLNGVDTGVVPRRAPKASVIPPVPPRAQKPEPKSNEVDLLGLSSSDESKAVSLLRSSVPLNQFELVDYITSKTTAQNAFKSGDYGTALDSYLTCMNKLPPKHELRVIILSNLGVVYKLVGQLRQSLESIESALELISVKEEVQNVAFMIDSKPVKYWYTKLIITKAEVLELMEKYELSLQHYQILIKDLGVLDKKIMDGKRRVDKIVNPDNHKAKPATPSTTPKPRPVPASRPASAAPVVSKPEGSDVDPLVKDKIDIMIQNWAQSRNNQLRGLLTNLGEIIPSNISMKPALRSLTTNELMLPKQVKVQYLKVISSIHPDKLASQCKDNKQSELVCNGVFIILNKAWDSFKEENKM